MSSETYPINAAIIGSVVAIAVSLIVAAVIKHSRQSSVERAAGKNGDENNKRGVVKQEPVTTTTPTTVSDVIDSILLHANSSESIDTARMDSMFDRMVVKVRQNATSLNDSQKLNLYGVYKQATEGNAPLVGPIGWGFPTVERLKYEAWAKFQGTSQYNAKNIYVAHAAKWILQLQDDVPVADDVEDFESILMSPEVMNVIDDDNEEEEDGMDLFGNGMGIRPSVPTNEDDDEDSDGENDNDPTHHRPLHAAARDGNVEQLRQLIQSQYNNNTNNNNDTTDQSVALLHIDDCDKRGVTALHLAADHGHDECVKLLLQAGANPNVADLDGISALLTAVIADHVSTAALLLDAGANPDQPDDDGDTPRICSESSTPEMIQLFTERLPTTTTTTAAATICS